MGKSSRARVFRVYLDLWIARLGSIFAWVWLVFWGLICIVSIPGVFSEGPKDGLDLLMPLICFGLAAVHWLLVRAAKNTRKLVQDFRLYSSVLAGDPDKSVGGICRALGLKEEEVMKRLQKMCARGYFRGHIDYSAGRMVFDPLGESVSAPAGTLAVRCPGCGAPNMLSGRSGECRYCGSPLTAENREA